jgi:hypothetical protein
MDDKHNHAILIASIVSLCDRATIDIAGGVDRAIYTIISISMKYMDRKILLECIVPGAYVDWEYIENSQTMVGNKQNLLGDSSVWLQLLPYLDFGELPMEKLELKNKHPSIWALYKAIDEHIGHRRNGWSFSDTCRLFLLSNVSGIPFKYITERYITNSLQKNSNVMCGSIMEAMADERHEPTVYLDSMKLLLST